VRNTKAPPESTVGAFFLLGAATLDSRQSLTDLGRKLVMVLLLESQHLLLILRVFFK